MTRLRRIIVAALAAAALALGFAAVQSGVVSTVAGSNWDN